MREGLQSLNASGKTTACQDRPVPYTEVEQSPDDAAALCGRGADQPCPLLEVCAAFGFTQSVYADKMVYGGYSWRRGLPLVSETSYQQQIATDRAKT